MDSSAFNRLPGPGLFVAVIGVLGFLALFGVWKWVEIIIWLVKHFRITYAQ